MSEIPIPIPVPIPTPTVTHHQKSASEFIAALDQIASTIPALDVSQISPADLVAGRQSVPMKFIETVIWALEQVPELLASGRLDPAVARDAMQFLEAFRSVDDKVMAFRRQLRAAMKSKKSSLVLAALNVYSIAQSFARDNPVIAAHVANMKRDLGRRGGNSLKLRKAKKGAEPRVETQPAPDTNPLPAKAKE